MATPPVSAVSYRRRLNDLAGQLREIAASVDHAANELFQMHQLAVENQKNLEKELEAAVRDSYSINPRIEDEAVPTGTPPVPICGCGAGGGCNPT